jgi:hypothetical protein
MPRISGNFLRDLDALAINADSHRSEGETAAEGLDVDLTSPRPKVVGSLSSSR